MCDLAWLVGYRFQSFAKREFDWLLVFDKDATIAVGCLWRLVEAARIRVTSRDDGQMFGRPTPVDAAVEMNRRLAGVLLESVTLRDGTLDLTLRFATGDLLEILPDSSGYEAWIVNRGSTQLIAVGGGELAKLGDDADCEKSTVGFDE